MDYSEDSEADVDLNIIKTGSGGFVEIQGTAEREPFTDKQMKAMLALADKGIKQLIAVQKQTVGNLWFFSHSPHTNDTGLLQSSHNTPSQTRQQRDNNYPTK